MHLFDRASRQNGSVNAAPVPTPVRLVIVTLLAALAAHYSYSQTATPAQARDFGQIWFAARALLHGQNPYALIGPGQALKQPWPLYYPLTAPLAVLPLAWVPLPLATALMSFLGVLAFAWALTEHGYAPLLAVTSIGVGLAVYLVQWSPLLAGALVVTPLSLLWVAKPTIGFALFATRPTRWAFYGGIGLVLLAFVVQPDWLTEWWAALHSANVTPGYAAGHPVLVQFPGGVLVLAALSRWRRWEARLLIVMALIPQTMSPYETVPLFLIPRGWIECAILPVLTYVVQSWAGSQPRPTFIAASLVNGQASVALYLVTTVMVLRRPNEGAIPAWLEVHCRRWPAWLRGTSSVAPSTVKLER